MLIVIIKYNDDDDNSQRCFIGPFTSYEEAQNWIALKQNEFMDKHIIDNYIDTNICELYDSKTLE